MLTRGQPLPIRLERLWNAIIQPNALREDKRITAADIGYGETVRAQIFATLKPLLELHQSLLEPLRIGLTSLRPALLLLEDRKAHIDRLREGDGCISVVGEVAILGVIGFARRNREIGHAILSREVVRNRAAFRQPRVSVNQQGHGAERIDLHILRSEIARREWQDFEVDIDSRFLCRPGCAQPA